MITTIIMWTDESYECRFLVHDSLSRGGQLQLLRDQHVLVERGLSDLGDATVLALEWQHQPRPAMVGTVPAA